MRREETDNILPNACCWRTHRSFPPLRFQTKHWAIKIDIICLDSSSPGYLKDVACDLVRRAKTPLGFSFHRFHQTADDLWDSVPVVARFIDDFGTPCQSLTIGVLAYWKLAASNLNSNLSIVYCWPTTHTFQISQWSWNIVEFISLSSTKTAH